MAVNGVNQQLSNMINRFAYLRTGTVVLVDPFLATVLIGGEDGTQIRAAYVRESEPEIGAVVAVIRQGASWFVLGTTSVSGGNSVQNPSFEQVNEDNTPVFWTLYNVSSTHAMAAVSSPGEAVPDPNEAGDNVLEVGPINAAAAGTSIVYSAAISVTSGETWELSAYYNGNYPAANTGTTDIVLVALWFADATDLYPATVSADSTIVSVSNIPENETMTVARGTVVVPGGAEFMRVGLRTGAQPSAGAHWDYVTARRIS